MPESNNEVDSDKLRRYEEGILWISLGIFGRRATRPISENSGMPYTDWELAKMLLDGKDITQLVGKIL